MKTWLSWLKKQTNDPRKSLKYFTQGGFLFALGMMLIILTEQLVSPGIKQEIIALFGLSFTVGGGLLALWGYLGLSLFKLLIYILERDTREH